MSAIEWTDATWNPTAGCDRVSPGCDRCYAMRMAARLERMGQTKYAGTAKDGDWTGRLNTDDDALVTPYTWRKPRRVFVNSMSDLFHRGVSDAFIHRVWQVMGQTPRHTYQILTKRPRRMRDLSESLPALPNVWLGVSVESQAYVHRLDFLRQTRAAVRFVSVEPILGPVDLFLDRGGIDWVIVGGESGPGARPMDLDWARLVRQQCAEARVPFFFKQVGGANKKAAGRLLDGRTWDEYPAPRISVSA